MYKLLLVDDESIIRDGISAMVDWQMADIVLTASCPDAFSALDSMMDDMPDILLTDVRMPGMNGLELIEKALLLNPMLEVLVLSGFSEFEYARQAMKYGVKEYLLKPCSKEEMELALKRACLEVTRRRERVLQLSGEREEQVGRLMGLMNEWAESGQDGAAIEKQLFEIEKTVQDISVLRDAFLGVLTDSAGVSHAEWAFFVIQDVLHAPENPIPIMAKRLMQLRGENGGVRDFVQKMLDYVNGHYMNETLSLQYIADRVLFRNADYIGREFTRCMGQKFSAYLLKIRMEHAKEMMASCRDMRSYEIAERVGMGANPHYFSQMFRKYTGLTAKEYRARMEGMSEK